MEEEGRAVLGGCIDGRHFVLPESTVSHPRLHQGPPSFPPAWSLLRSTWTAAAAAGGPNTIVGRDSIPSFRRRRASWITAVSSFSMY